MLVYTVQADLMPANCWKIPRGPITTNITDTKHLVQRIVGTASATEDRTLNTWNIAFKLAY